MMKLETNMHTFGLTKKKYMAEPIDTTTIDENKNFYDGDKPIKTLDSLLAKLTSSRYLGSTDKEVMGSMMGALCHHLKGQYDVELPETPSGTSFGEIVFHATALSLALHDKYTVDEDDSSDSDDSSDIEDNIDNIECELNQPLSDEEEKMLDEDNSSDEGPPPLCFSDDEKEDDITPHSNHYAMGRSMAEEYEGQSSETVHDLINQMSNYMSTIEYSEFLKGYQSFNE